MSDLINASEIARHSFCARAWAYDRQIRTRARPTRLRGLMLVGMVSVGSLLALAVALLFAQDAALIVLSLVIGLVLFGVVGVVVRALRRMSSRVAYHGVAARPNRQPLVAGGFGLAGTPPYLLESKGETIPLLLKQNPAPNLPHQAHVLQVIAYCLLLAENSGKYPPFGVIRYGDGRTFEVDFDEEAVEYLSRWMDQIEADRHLASVPITHDERRRCFACQHRRYCDQSLF